MSKLILFPNWSLKLKILYFDSSFCLLTVSVLSRFYLNIYFSTDAILPFSRLHSVGFAFWPCLLMMFVVPAFYMSLQFCILTLLVALVCGHSFIFCLCLLFLQFDSVCRFCLSTYIQPVYCACSFCLSTVSLVLPFHCVCRSSHWSVCSFCQWMCL